MPVYENGPVTVHYEEAGAGVPLLCLPGGGLNFGAGNLLFDELDGGNQVPELLIRGGTSYSGPIESDAPGSLPEEVDTDG